MSFGKTGYPPLSSEDNFSDSSGVKTVTTSMSESLLLSPRKRLPTISNLPSFFDSANSSKVGAFVFDDGDEGAVISASISFVSRPIFLAADIANPRTISLFSGSIISGFATTASMASAVLSSGLLWPVDILLRYVSRSSWVSAIAAGDGSGSSMRFFRLLSVSLALSALMIPAGSSTP